VADASAGAPKARARTAKADTNSATDSGDHATSDGYVVPLVGVRVPGVVVNVGFWGGLAGAALLGTVDLPFAALLGAGVVIARHRSNQQ
jgi:hypothetical protein